MALLKKKTRKAIRKIIKKTVNKHGADVAEHLATAGIAALATYLGAEGDKAPKKLKKAVKRLGSRNKIAKAVVSRIPALSDFVNKDDSNGHKRQHRDDRTKKSTAA